MGVMLAVTDVVGVALALTLVDDVTLTVGVTDDVNDSVADADGDGSQRPYRESHPVPQCSDDVPQ